MEKFEISAEIPCYQLTIYQGPYRNEEFLFNQLLHDFKKKFYPKSSVPFKGRYALMG